MATGMSPPESGRHKRSGDKAATGAASSLRIRDILFPTDLSSESDRAFEHARFLAELFQARITLYHAVEAPRAGYADWIDPGEEQIYERVAKRAHEVLSSAPRTSRFLTRSS